MHEKLQFLRESHTQCVTFVTKHLRSLNFSRCVALCRYRVTHSSKKKKKSKTGGYFTNSFQLPCTIIFHTFLCREETCEDVDVLHQQEILCQIETIQIFVRGNRFRKTNVMTHTNNSVIQSPSQPFLDSLRNAPPLKRLLSFELRSFPVA